MRDGFDGAWLAATKRVWLHAHRGRHALQSSLNSSIATSFRMMLLAVGSDGGVWSDARADAVAGRILGQRSGDDPYAAGMLRCVRLGHALASGTAAHLTPSEHEVLAAMGEPLPDAPSRTLATPPPGETFGLDFAFGYLGRVEGRRLPRLKAGTGRTTVTRVDASAFVPFDLRTAHDVPVRALRTGDRWFRPLIASDGLRPLPEEELAWACSGREPWADDPFADGLAPHGRHGQAPALSLRERVRLADDLVPDRGPLDESAVDRAVRAGELLSVDGVIHVGTAAQTWHVVLRTSPDVDADGRPVEEVALGWRLGRLTSESHLDALGRVDRDAPDWSGGSEARSPRAFATFPHGSAQVAIDVCRDAAFVLGRRHVGSYEGLPPLEGDQVAVMRAIIADLPRTSGHGPRVDALATAFDDGRVDVLEGSRSSMFPYEAVLGSLGRVAAQVLYGEYDATPEVDDDCVTGLVL